jgi:hypothetical protein
MIPWAAGGQTAREVALTGLAAGAGTKLALTAEGGPATASGAGELAETDAGQAPSRMSSRTA